MLDYFLHIPKTGGTTFTSFLDSHYKSDRIFPYQTWNHYLPNKNIKLKHYALARGHFGYSFRHLFPHENIRYMTMLRNPVERVISQYHHMTVDKKNNNWILDLPYGSLEDMLEKVPEFFFNKQVKHLAIDFNVLKSVNDKKFLYESCKQMNSVGQISDLYDLACERLEKFYFVGVLEHYEESMQKLCKLMRWSMPHKIQHLNILPNKKPASEYDTKIIDRINELNEYDFKLYDFAKKILKKTK